MFLSQHKETLDWFGLSLYGRFLHTRDLLFELDFEQLQTPEAGVEFANC